MFSDDFYIDALGRQAEAVDSASVAHDQDLLDGNDGDETARVLAFEVGAYRTLLARATPVQNIVHAAERATSFHRQ